MHTYLKDLKADIFETK